MSSVIEVSVAKAETDRREVSVKKDLNEVIRA